VEERKRPKLKCSFLYLEFFDCQYLEGAIVGPEAHAGNILEPDWESAARTKGNQD
jgi:hypothetical protein